MDLVILAAGKGTRLWPITNHYPKSMIRVLGKPLIEWIITPFYSKVEKIVIVVGVQKEKVIDYFSSSQFKEKIVFVEQKEQKGTGHALLQAESEVSGDFFVVNGDNFFDPIIFEKIFYQSRQGFFLAGKKVKDVSAFGAIVSENELLKKIVEKGSSGEGLINTNLAFLPKTFFNSLKKTGLSPRGEIELTDAFNSFASENTLKIMELADYWNDVGFYWNYLEVNSFACEKMLKNEIRGQVEEGVIVKGKVFIGEGTLVKAPCRIEGPAYIGKNSVIGPHAFIRKNSYIEDECHVGSSEVKDSIVMSYSNAAHFSYVGDSVVCEDVNFGAGAKTANLRFDGKTIIVKINGKEYDTGRKKLGPVIGANTKLGVDVCISCGKIVGSDVKIYPNVFVKENVLDNEVLRGEFV
ncbi:NTP transferase domain-containing protein [Candidatus Micrarchaeota archaeon]|nr:NTP transferase domain-containing protein [Candidatus Micrarchaeota archaeon]